MIDQLMQDAKYIIEEGDGCHDWDHTMRVYNLSQHIGMIENADLEILAIAAILHDIGRPTEMKLRRESENDTGAKNICHAEIGALMAENILNGYGLFPERIEKIKHCILTHRFSKGHEPQSKEAKILYDADKLDNIGAIGILRAANYSGTYNARTHNPEVKSEDVRQYSREDTAYQHYHIKLKKIKDKLFTKEAKKLGEERDKFMKDFFDRVNDECRGKI